VFKETLGRRSVLFLAEVQIVLYVFYRELFGAFPVVQGKMCQAPQVVVQGACRFTVYGKALGQFVL